MTFCPESEILHLHFWMRLFIKLKESGVLVFETQGKNKGCWVMRRAGTSKAGIAEARRPAQRALRKTRSRRRSKVIVRSNGTVGYVGKDIAYHMWKFGLLGRDFGYRSSIAIPTDTIAGFHDRR